MAIEERSTGWRMGQSWYVLLTLPFGLTSFLAFFYLGWRARRPKWIMWGIFYLAAVIRIFSFPMETGPDGTEVMSNTAGGAILALWIITLVHALLARREFLGILDARDSQPQMQSQMEIHAHAPRPAADPFATLRDEPRAGTSAREAFALFEENRLVEPRPEFMSTPPPVPNAQPSLPVAPPPPPSASPAVPAAPPPPPPAAPGELPPPFSGPAPFGGRNPFAEDDDRPPPPPPPPPRRPGGRQVDY